MNSVRRSSGIVGIAVIGSRLAGLVRDTTFAAMFGASKFLDSYLAAFQIPNLMRDLFAEGALSQAFTTTFTKIWEKDGEKPAWALANLLFSIMILVVGAICIVGILLSTPIVQATNFGFHNVPGKFELTVELTRILFPFILFVSLAAVVMGILNARFIFGLPASASTIFNIVSVILGVLFAYIFDPQLDWRHPHFSSGALYGVSLGVLIGGMAQLAVQLPSLWKLGFRFHWRLDFHDEALRQVWRLMWPSLIAGSAVQVNVLVNGMFASEINGARSWLYCAFRLMQFPIGVFGVAIATVTLPAVARHHARDDLVSFGRTVEESLRLAFFLTLPAAAGLFALAPDIIRVIYEHGQFLAVHTEKTAQALRAYTIGLAGYAGIKVLVPCFYALNKPRIPLNVSLLGIGVNLVLNILLVTVFNLQHVGLAMTTSVVALVNFLQLVVYMRKDIRFGEGLMWFDFFSKTMVSAIFTGWLAHFAARSMCGILPGFAGALLSLVSGVLAGVMSYVILTALLHISETTSLWQVLKKKLDRSSHTT
jgi:putative peptidoglycan lipid II flippase